MVTRAFFIAAALGIAAAAAACADGTNRDELLGGAGDFGQGNLTARPDGGPDGGGTGPAATPPPLSPADAAKAFFSDKVFPSLADTCSVCHGTPPSSGAPSWLPRSSATDAYAMIEARGYLVPATPLVRKGIHEGPELTPEQRSLIQHWLELEQTARGAKSPAGLFAELGRCLDPALFASIKLGDLRTVPRATEDANECTGCNDAPCQSCHLQGEYGMHANFSDIGTKTFDALAQNQTSPEGMYLIAKYVTTSGVKLVPSTALVDKAAVTKDGPAYSHPKFTITPDGAKAIEAFAKAAIAAHDSGNCKGYDGGVDSGSP